MMRSRSNSRLILAATAFVSLAIAACQTNDAGDQRFSAIVTSGDTARVHVDSAAGDVTPDTTVQRVTGKWLTDANVLSLLTTMSAKQIAAADVELQGWRSDSVRAFAASVARDHAAIQHSVDSLALRLRLAPIAPALADPLTAAMQASIDSLKQDHSASLDRAFIRQQVASESLMSNYAEQLAAVAEQPEVQALSASAAARVGAELTRLHAIDAASRMSDSLTTAASADSASKRAKRRKYKPT